MERVSEGRLFGLRLWGEWMIEMGWKDGNER
jgi:hypothetical protein